MNEEEKRALEKVLLKKILKLLVATNTNFLVKWGPKNLRIQMSKRSLKNLQKSNRWFKGITIQRSVISIVKLDSKETSSKCEMAISGRLYISRSDVTIILKAGLKNPQ